MEGETTPNVSSMSDEELRELIDRLTAEEQEVSYRRRILHGQIDLLRAELVNRQKLSEILVGKSEPPTKPPS